MVRCVLSVFPLVVIAVGVMILGLHSGPEDLPQPELQPEETTGVTGLAIDPAALGEGWEEAFEPETFGPGELYAKINGGADVYLAHGFRRLQVHSFLHSESGDYVEVFLYDQGDQASAMHALEKPPDAAEDAEFGGYFAEASLFMVRGDLYVQILAAVDTPRTRAAVQAIGRRVMASLPA
ncbi:hypothetical protein JXA88_08995 [Candidatus Fermentibacteria bacterium]|nr:hypothetical protein [Candidatus Fermentibacteria bacterium]